MEGLVIGGIVAEVVGAGLVTAALLVDGGGEDAQATAFETYNRSLMTRLDLCAVGDAVRACDADEDQVEPTEQRAPRDGPSAPREDADDEGEAESADDGEPGEVEEPD